MHHLCCYSSAHHPIPLIPAPAHPIGFLCVVSNTVSTTHLLTSPSHPIYPPRLTSDGFYDAGPAAPSALAPTPAPDYSTIDAKPWNAAIMGLFIRKLEAALGERTAKQGYEAVIELTK